MIHFQPDFRWMLYRADSPWYPTLQIYRQPRPGDWESVVKAEVHTQLDARPSGGGGLRVIEFIKCWHVMSMIFAY
jgi:hypothetical protein